MKGNLVITIIIAGIILITGSVFAYKNNSKKNVPSFSQIQNQDYSTVQQLNIPPETNNNETSHDQLFLSIHSTNNTEEGSATIAPTEDRKSKITLKLKDPTYYNKSFYLSSDDCNNSGKTKQWTLNPGSDGNTETILDISYNDIKDTSLSIVMSDSNEKINISYSCKSSGSNKSEEVNVSSSSDGVKVKTHVKASGGSTASSSVHTSIKSNSHSEVTINSSK